jgi:hypothetical protein
MEGFGKSFVESVLTGNDAAAAIAVLGAKTKEEIFKAIFFFFFFFFFFSTNLQMDRRAFLALNLSMAAANKLSFAAAKQKEDDEKMSASAAVSAMLTQKGAAVVAEAPTEVKRPKLAEPVVAEKKTGNGRDE